MTGKLELWEVRSDKRLDEDEVPIEWAIVPRQMDFNAKWTMKKLITGELYVRNMYGTVEFDVDYRPDDYLCSVDWAEFSECATTEICEDDACAVLVNRHPQYRTRMQLPQPADECNTVANRNMRFAYKFQPVIKVRGAVTITGLRLIAETVDDTLEVKCGDAACKVHACCPINPFEHNSEATE